MFNLVFDNNNILIIIKSKIIMFNLVFDNNNILIYKINNF